MRLRRLAVSAARTALASYVLLGIAGYLLAERVIFQPPQGPPVARVLEAPIIHLHDSDRGRVAAVYLERPGSRWAIHYSHGNAEDLSGLGHRLDLLRSLGFSVLAYDYYGYGASTGRPTEGSAYRAADVAYEHLTGRLGFPPDRLIAYGFSLGGAVAADLASRRPVGGLAIESSFTSAFRVVTQVAIFPFDRFRTADKLASLRCPILVMHGTRDRVIHSSHGQALYRLAPEPKRALWVEGADHGEAPELAAGRFAEAMAWLVDPTTQVRRP